MLPCCPACTLLCPGYVLVSPVMELVKAIIVLAIHAISKPIVTYILRSVSVPPRPSEFRVALCLGVPCLEWAGPPVGHMVTQFHRVLGGV